MTIAMMFDIIALVMLPVLTIFLLGSLGWDAYQKKKRIKEDEKVFEDEMMRIHGGQEDE